MFLDFRYSYIMYHAFHIYRFEKRDKELSNDSISLIFVLCSRFRTLGREDDWVVGPRLHARANHAVDLLPHLWISTLDSIEVEISLVVA